MAISRFQMNRQLRAYGGIMGQDGRRNYGIGSFFQKKIMDPIKKAVKSDAGKALGAVALGYGLDKFGIPGTGTGPDDRLGKGSISNIFRGIGNIFTGGRTPAGTTGSIDRRTGEIARTGNRLDEFGVKGSVYGTPPFIPTSNRTDDDKGFVGKTIDFFTKDRLGTDKSIADLLMTPQALAIGSGLLAGAFTKDKDDPAFTGQDVGLNLRDIRRLANVTDPKAGQAIGLSFLPDVEARKFTPTEMAASFAAGEPVDFTEKRQQAQEGGMIREAEKYATQKQNEFLKNVDMNNIPRTGNLQREQERAYENAYREYMERNKKAEGGIMGDQKDFEEFLQDMKDRDMGMMQDKILRDFENYMKRKRMLENLPEAKDGGIMKASYGYDEAMSDTYDSYLDMKKKGLIPPTMSFDEFLQEVVPEMSKRQDTSGMMASDILGDESDDLAIQLFGKPVKELNPAEMQELQMEIDRLQNKFRAAKGGIASMAKGGMMDMGGMEMDLRGGGFVPMGRAEKADDVPARLSKNEFVFTADAVRAAGGGDVDKGADKMYATMKKLEDRVA